MMKEMEENMWASDMEKVAKNGSSMYWVIGLLILSLVVGLVIGYSINKVKTTENLPEVGGVQCTMEARLCPDGSSVGRSGPNCEFDPCPGEPGYQPEANMPPTDAVEVAPEEGNSTLPSEGEMVACTMDAMECPDGSFVSRQGPNCEFAACPGN